MPLPSAIPSLLPQADGNMFYGSSSAFGLGGSPGIGASVTLGYTQNTKIINVFDAFEIIRQKIKEW